MGAITLRDLVMNRLKIALLTGVAFTACATMAQAQSAATEKPAQTGQAAEAAQAEEPTEVGTVVVRAQSDGIRSSIDSVSYSLANDLQAATGSLADALRNVPSVDVDPEGNVSLRGDSNVTILVDGRPSGVLSGESRAQAVLQLSADQYSRIEVMTNPSAAYSPEGSGGVINLITKPNVPRPNTQASGSLRANVGSDGRWNVGLSGVHQMDRLTLSGDVSYRDEANTYAVPILRERLDGAGQVVETTTLQQDSDTEQSGGFGRLTAEYRLTDKTQLTAEVTASSFEIVTGNVGYYRTRNPTGDLLTGYDLHTDGDITFQNMRAKLGVVHRFDDSGHEWSNELRIDRMKHENDFVLETVNIEPPVPGKLESTTFNFDTATIGFTSAYVRPGENDSKLRLGYELNHTAPESDIDFRRGTTAANLAPVPELSNRFEGTQTVHALYATYERPFGEKFSAQAGLRLEQADIEVNDLTGGQKISRDYFRAYPTAHLQYQLTENQTLRGSYSRRIQRPQLNQLNPFVYYQDPLNRRAGNPDLQPQETDAIELMWQVRKGQSFYQATVYHRDTDKAFTDVATPLPGDILMIRPENLGSRRDTGVELTASGRLHPTLRYMGSANIYRQEIDANGLPGSRDREGTMVSGRLTLNWQPTDKDFMQVTGMWMGESLLAQGTRDAGGMVNIGYRRKLNDRLSLNVTGRDVFGTFKNTTIYETAAFRERTDTNIDIRAFFVGLTWQFGGGQRRQPEQFDFSTGPTGS